MIECLAPKMIECAEPLKEAVNIYEMYFLVHLPPPPLPKVNIKETYEKSSAFFIFKIKISIKS